MDAFVLALASGLGTGYLPAAPGTFGTVLGFALWWGIGISPLSALPGGAFLAALALALAAVPVCTRAERIWQETDPGRVVLDEVIAVPVCLLPYAPGNTGPAPIITAFLLFRLFDIAKPPPVFQAQRAPGGLGVVLDDLLAGAYTCCILLLLQWIGVPGF